MDRFLKTALVLTISMMGFVVNAQRFKTHAVKKGETLSDIANQYGVPVNSILEYNREIKDANSDLERNTILVIPLDAQKNDSKEEVLSGPETESKKPTQEEPIGFTSHTVQRKETLYGIAKRYHITEEDIKKYNPELYASQLRKKMVLRIPKYHREKSGDTTEQSQMDESLFEEYTVAPKETRWSIAHTYGISIDSMLSLNPTLSKTTDYIQEGQKLKMPKRPGSDLGNQETQLYTSYTVPPKMTFYSLEKKFGIGAEELIKVNPEITERGGLKEGMVIRIPEKRIDPGTVNTDNFIFYEVKPKQTEFSLTRKLGMSYGELVELNPELRDGLKAGMVLKLPKDLSGDFEVRNALVLDKVSLPDSVNRAHRPKMLFMLPFRLNRFNALDEESTEDRLKMPSWTTLSLSMYSGAQMAADSIARLGISVDIKTIDNQYNYAKTKELIRTEDFS
ncbi:MAG: LysM peptidoglycan-binding domain-containing protein, partial [Flavobacteriaceae bacterium]